ncbi:hypothetical protein [Streptomyces parvus]|uniref:hypothetical protein n=1 Tax=Streptomyces parvus TaxID=66428 RepID=UPI0036B2EF2D
MCQSGRRGEPPSAAIDYPTSFAELLERLRELPHLSFAGNRKTARGLDSKSADN